MRSSRLKQKLYLDRLKRKHNTAALVAINHACVNQGGDIGMYRLHVTLNPAGGFAYRHGACAAQSFEQLPALGRQHLPKKFRRGKGMVADQLRQLGQAFFILDAARQRRLGLHLGCLVINAHDGEIVLESAGPGLSA